jgi:hypothetical protein
MLSGRYPRYYYPTAAVVSARIESQMFRSYLLVTVVVIHDVALLFYCT